MDQLGKGCLSHMLVDGGGGLSRPAFLLMLVII